MATKYKPGSKCGYTLTPIANPNEFDPTKPVNPNSGENYPSWYPESLYNITYDGTWENFPTTPGAINPNTGVAYTPEELIYYSAPTQFGDPFAEGYQGKSGTTPSGMVFTPGPTGSGELTSTALNPETGEPYTAAEIRKLNIPEGMTLPEYLTQQYGTEGGPYREGYPHPAPTDEDGNLCSQTGKPPCGSGTGGWGGAGGGITPATVTPAPPYEISPEQQAFEDMYSGKITDWVENPQGIPEETQALMIQQQTDSLKASETENLRVMKNNMERRGITNSGFVFANEQSIRSNTSKAIASGIADVQIKSALMKMASFEKAMGQAGQFLGYLSEQSQLKYAPDFATWSAEQMAKMQAWQADIDIQKMAINQAYQTQNIKLQAQLTSQLAEQTHGYDIQLAEMELEWNKQKAKAEGAGNLVGSASGLFASLIKPS